MDLTDAGGLSTDSSREASKVALELMKQLITLSSGVLALSGAFIDKFHASGVREHLPLLIAWALLIGSIVCSLDVISAIVKSELKPEYAWYEGRGKNVARIAKWLFVLGIASFGLFAIVSVSRNDPRGSKPPSGVVILS